MNIYQNQVNVIIRLDTGLPNLNVATSIKMMVLKPSGTTETWTATQYLDTTQITYTTVTGDLDEVGDYVFQASITFGADPATLGDPVTITVYQQFVARINVSHLLNIFRVYYRTIPVQTYTQYISVPEEGTDCAMYYDEFEVFSDLAVDELQNILDARGISLTSTQTYVAYCHLVADYFEMGDPDWNFRSQNMGSGVSFKQGRKDWSPRSSRQVIRSGAGSSKSQRNSKRAHGRG